ncbi:hypothetical protein QR680_006353 [Steinernema hermaphroditum]|uniref:TIL domain-containing protein n=1 Tax=Steinernema hermaphroditum TaxID=289476 RepID=A0AA39HV55_9BILA|nr:hypothetical protein QR680_006353 [Steinernema hermaphroditum]
MLLVLFISLHAIGLLAQTTPRCGENEFWNPVATCEDTCQNRNLHLCLIMSHPQCTCIEGYIRQVENGKCIRVQDCPCTSTRKFLYNPE